MKHFPRLKCLTILLFLGSSTLSAQTYYYKLESVIRNGNRSDKVSGGQFITFTSDMCYESDRSGYTVNNGRMNFKAIENGQKIYFGNCYWGDNKKMMFSEDLSSMKVIPNENESYLYKRTTPPDKVTTSSLIRDRGSNTQPVVFVNPNNESPINGNMGSPIGSSSNSNSNTVGRPSRTTTPTQRVCVTCHGDGKCNSCHGSGKRTDNSFGTGTNYAKTCGVCGGSGRCSVCRGTGHR